MRVEDVYKAYQPIDNLNLKKDTIEKQKQQQIINKLKTIEKRVIAHELAHKSVGGEFTGAIRYKYVVGPDGKRYIVGGDVPIYIKKGKTPEETIKIAEKIRAAALAPSDPSPQDLRVAAMATALEMQARAELYRKNMEDSKKGNNVNLYT
ncbi:MAG: protein-glutamate O-methyltransferase [Aquificota bacterium]|nr:MAG: protein-glutamate O-methyltransferase [Aquificota bacterium]